MANKQEIVRYAASEQGVDVAEAIKANLGGDTITAQDLPRVSMPSGGGQLWELPGLDGPEAMRELRGVVLHHHRERKYWPQESTQMDQPPACAAVAMGPQDVLVGVGNPGGVCESTPTEPGCPLAQFGTALDQQGERTRGQACKALRVIYLLLADRALPVVIQLPPTSLASWRKYAFAVGGAGHRLEAIETVFSLEATKSAGGKAYSQAVFTAGRVLEADEQEGMRRYAESFVASL